MNLSPTVFAIPFFALMIAVETYFSVRKEENYDRKDVWTNIALGFGSAVFGAVFGLFQGVIYNFIYENAAPYQMPMHAWWAWVILLFVDDFAYYWFHRASHEIRFFWNFHVVHHSSNQYNLSVAVRQSWFSGTAHWIFYVSVAFLGFPLWSFVFMHGLNLIYQFWIHTKTVKKLPAFIEYIFNTPSHHRVHHGVNNVYLDKNYAGIFIFWDRILGTFVGEDETPRYGIIKPINSYNWLWINTHGWFEMFEAMKKQKTFLGKIRCVFGSPNMEF
ncbi:MAG TPA: sterol desaturase family protein [Pyrinomonadaceae bacterium]|nr:sterol desaturase family protein [Pyrinomonadaceae bacterium]